MPVQCDRHQAHPPTPVPGCDLQWSDSHTGHPIPQPPRRQVVSPFVDRHRHEMEAGQGQKRSPLRRHHYQPRRRQDEDPEPPRLAAATAFAEPVVLSTQMLPLPRRLSPAIQRDMIPVIIGPAATTCTPRKMVLR
jgi:hypothetical protein